MTTNSTSDAPERAWPEANGLACRCPICPQIHDHGSAYALTEALRESLATPHASVNQINHWRGILKLYGTPEPDPRRKRR